MRRTFLSALACCLLATSSCTSGAVKDANPPVPAPDGGFVVAGQYIKHIVIVVQENRSFDNFFSGYPGADTTTYGYTHDGTKVPLETRPFEKNDLNHFWQYAVSDINGGKMNGFDGDPNDKNIPLYAYTRIERSQIEPYWHMAQRYVLADHMFSTELGPSYTAHLHLIAGTTQVTPTSSVVDLPSQSGDCEAPAGTFTNTVDTQGVYHHHSGPYPCYTQFPTIADSLDAGHVTWRYYDQVASYGTDLWNAFRGIKKIYAGPDWANVVYEPMGVIDDAKSGNLPGVSWVIPGYFNSDHPGVGSDTGPSWVASVVNAVGQGPDWKSSLVIVLWDDWGGWYDNAVPPKKYYFGLGLRVPCIIISPYAKGGYVDHTVYDFGSILKTVEQVFHVKSIETTDAHAASMLDALDFTKAPRPFKPFAAKYPESFFRAQPPSDQPIDTE